MNDGVALGGRFGGGGFGGAVRDGHNHEVLCGEGIAAENAESAEKGKYLHVFFLLYLTVPGLDSFGTPDADSFNISGGIG